MIQKLIRDNGEMMAIVYAILSAFFAALTSILAKIGIDGVNSNLATAIRTTVVLFMAWFVAFGVGSQGEIAHLSRKNWIFLILSGLATGASWLFYYRAIQMGEVHKVTAIDKLSVVLTFLMAFLFLHETPNVKRVVGCVLITLGCTAMIL